MRRYDLARLALIGAGLGIALMAAIVCAVKEHNFKMAFLFTVLSAGCAVAVIGVIHAHRS